MGGTATEIRRNLRESYLSKYDVKKSQKDSLKGDRTQLLLRTYEILRVSLLLAKVIEEVSVRTVDMLYPATCTDRYFVSRDV